MTEFQGIKYKDASNWIGFVPQSSGPIRYAEIGVLCGNNVLSVENLYANHPDSVLVCIDPWINYGEYAEYNGKITTYYDMFLQNTAHIANKLEVHREFSHKVLPTLEDDSFDIIYIDGNHERHYVVEDAVLAFRKLKVGGWLIFNEYEGPDGSLGMYAFLNGYARKINNVIGQNCAQLFVKKIS